MAFRSLYFARMFFMAGTLKLSKMERRSRLLRAPAMASSRSMCSTRAENRSFAAVGKKGWLECSSLSAKRLLDISSTFSSMRSSAVISLKMFQ